MYCILELVKRDLHFLVKRLLGILELVKRDLHSLVK